MAIYMKFFQRLFRSKLSIKYVLRGYTYLHGSDSLAKHEFGIIDSFEENTVNDDLVEELIIKYNEELMAIKTYFQVTTQPGTGLDYCGVTLIPPESLKQFRDIIIKANNHFKAKELQLLTEKITEAITGNKYLIHYGI